MPRREGGKPRKQVAALPVAWDADGTLRVLMITSRETRRFIVPKGWPMKGWKDHHAAETEAREEAGLVGHAHPKPVGTYLAWKRGGDFFQLVKVRVFAVQVQGHLDDWKEKGQRAIAWLGIEDAASLIDEPGLAAIVLRLPELLPSAWREAAALSCGTALGIHPIVGRDRPQAARAADPRLDP